MPKSTGNKTIFKQGTQTIGEVTSVGAVTITVDSIETSNLSDDFRTFMPGMADGGEVTIGGHFTGSDAGQDAMYAAVAAKTVGAYSIVYPAAIGETWSFNGFITSFAILEATNDDPIGFEATIKISGQPVLAASA